MLNNYDYMNLPYDLSGAMAKNRFRNEILWGLKKIFSLHKSSGGYVVVFDYVCDIEVHTEKGYEFYQVKTQNNNENYKLAKALRKNKGNSILGKLYILKYDECENDCKEVVVALVSNAPLYAGSSSYNNIESLSFLDLEDDVVDDIKSKLKDELKKDDVTLENTYFIRTGLDLFEPDKTLIGETALFFEQLYGSEPQKVTSLYRVLANEISNKACYELRTTDYNELLSKKGISRSDFENILGKYIEHTDIAVEKSKKYITEKYKGQFRKRMNSLKALSKVIIRLKSDKWLLKLEKEIMNYIIDEIENIPDDDSKMIELVIEHFNNCRTIDFSTIELETLIILVLMRLEEDVYE